MNGFWGEISMEYLVIVLYGLFPVFLPSSHAQRRFIFVLFESQ